MELKGRRAIEGCTDLDTFMVGGGKIFSPERMGR
jgi:hypothetical protein